MVQAKMKRRSFLGTILALSAAPAIVHASSLMPGRPTYVRRHLDVLFTPVDVRPPFVGTVIPPPKVGDYAIIDGKIRQLTVFFGWQPTPVPTLRLCTAGLQTHK